jgi:hypothetical protein
VSSNAGTEAPAPPGRPEVPHPAPPGSHWEAAAEPGREWAAARPGAKCRWRGAGATRAHGEPAVIARLHGLTRRIWWNYCLAHADGRWLENGVVMVWKTVPDKEAP